MNDIELAGEIERSQIEIWPQHEPVSVSDGRVMTDAEKQQIIAALRRGHEPTMRIQGLSYRAPERPPTIIKDFPGQAVEDFRKRHGGRLPSDYAPSPFGEFDEILAQYDRISEKLDPQDAEADFVMRGSDWREIREQIQHWERPPFGEMVEMRKVRKVLVNFDIEAAVGDYEFRGDEGDYTPDEKDRVLLTDFAHGFIGELCEALGKLSAAEAEGPKPYAHVMGACPLCGRTDPHSHTSGPLGMS